MTHSSSAAVSEAGLMEHFDDMAQQRHAGVMGMWVFLATELMLFGGIFAAFFINRLLSPGAFAQAAGHLDVVLGAVNTAILLTSGLTMALAEQAVNEHRRAAGLAMLAATLALGAVFLVIKGYEWHHEYNEGLVPLLDLAFHYPGEHPGRARLFFGFYFTMTGLHALHMAVGLVQLAVMVVIVRRWRRPARIARQMRMTGLYWAFVDIVWVFVFTSLYLLRA